MANTSASPAGKAKRAVGSKRKKVHQPLRANQRKKKRLAEALRAAGLDEGKVAEAYVLVVKKLRTGKSDENATLKLLVDVLKECCRILEPPGAQGSRASEGPAVVNLYHNVPRPVRGFRRGSADAEAEEEAQ
jgi:hypothetical protein